VLSRVFLSREGDYAVTDSPLQQSLFRDVAAGDGHAVAVSAEGLLYSWGLNQCAQLGVGHCQSKHFPQRVDCFLRKVMMHEEEEAADMNAYSEFSDLILTKAFAGGHSSGITRIHLTISDTLLSLKHVYL
jgi:alpha-tubulin suppressor-like RCC1 family protein